MKPLGCDSASLDLILSDHSDHPHFDHVVDHVGECQACQGRLEELTADQSWWDDTKNMLSGSTDIVVPGLPRAETLVLAEVGAGSSSWGDSPETFLDAPSHPEMLGRLGKYDVEAEIGRGGMGIVLKGFDRELNRPVAIKLLAPHLASSGTARQRFVREARAAAAVVHDNVVAIHGIETEGKLPAIVMPLVSGSSLQEHVERHGAIDPIDVVRIGIQVASGLAAAHAQGLVHRDIKPANILLENGLNRVQITDFGLARAAHEANLTRSGVIAGTPHFMSPEQAAGDSIDQRADLFSLGSVLYFMASGELPFVGSTPMGVMQRVCNVEPKPLRELNSAVPEQLESVVEKLLEKSAGNRFESASELQNYLGDYLAHLQQPTSRQAPRRLMTASRRKRRRTWFMTAGVCLLSCAALFVGWQLWNGVGSATPRPLAAPAPPVTQPPPTANPAVATKRFSELGVARTDQLDSELQSIDAAISQLEGSASSPSLTRSRDTLPQLDAEIKSLETPRRAGQASNFDMEVQSIDAALKWLERSAGPTSSPTPKK